MITNRFLKGYAVIKSQWINGNILDEYIPFLATIIISEEMGSIDEHLLCQKMKCKYDVCLQPSFIRSVLSHAMGKGLISKVREQYVANKEALQRYVITDEEFDKEWDTMLAAFFEFCKSIDEKTDSKEITQNHIIDFINHYDDHVLYNNIEDIDVHNNAFLYCWCQFIQSIKSTDQSIYSFILGLCSANLLKNTLFYSSESVRDQSDVTLYLDTPMIFALLGMDSSERKSSYEYIIKKAKEAGMVLKIFDHNLEEVRGIIERAARWVHNSQYDSAKANKVAEFLHDSAMEEIEIIELIDGIETELNSIDILVEHSAYLAEENDFQIDEKQLADAIKAEYGKRSIKYRTEEIYENTLLAM